MVASVLVAAVSSRSPKSIRRLSVAEAPTPHDPMPTTLTPPNAVHLEDNCLWAATFAINLPEGAFMHPATHEHLFEILDGRCSGVEPLDDGFDVIFLLGEHEEDAARIERDEAVSSVLVALAIPEASVTYRALVDLRPHIGADIQPIS